MSDLYSQCNVFYISEKGNDSWSGRQAEPDRNGNDGPFATIAGARDAIRLMRASENPADAVEVRLRGGRYGIEEAVAFDERDSGVTYRSYSGEKAVIDAGKRIEGWKAVKIGAIDVWMAEIPEVAEGKWYFRELFVNGARRVRPRLPKKGVYRMDGAEDIKDEDDVWVNLFNGSYAFRYKGDDIKKWTNISDIDIIVDHFWVDERMQIDSIDEDTRTVRCARRSIFVLKDDVTGNYSQYFLENVFEALSEPGEWYLDRSTGMVYYIPLPGESLVSAEIIAPYATQFVKICGNPDENRFVEALNFKDMAFCSSDWFQPPVTKAFDIEGVQIALDKGHNVCTTPQSAIHVPGTIYMEGARHCSISGCSINHIGWYGIEVSDGCSDINISDNEISDMGAGGIKVGGSNISGPVLRRNGNNRITGNLIKDGGHVFRNGTGIFLTHSFGNTISRNHIHDLYYIGISCGWVWGYWDNVTKDNLIENNYIHHLGHGVMSDLGGIYTLGVQPGTVIRGNLIHDIVKKNYGGRGIYLDEGSAHIIVENNICVRVSSHPFLVHYGRENIIRNNIFGLGSEGQANLIRGEEHNSFTFERNIVLTDGKPVFTGENAPVEDHKFISDLNLVWDVSGKGVLCGNGGVAEDTNWYLKKSYTFEEWQRLGYDTHSINADPLFKDIAKLDFIMDEASPAFSLGFKPIDLSNLPAKPE